MSAADPADPQQDLQATLENYLAQHPNTTAAQIQKDLGLPTKPNSALYRGLRAGRFLCLESKPPQWCLNPRAAELNQLQEWLDRALQAASPGWVGVRELGLTCPKKDLNKLLYQGNKEGRYEFQLTQGTTKPVWRLKIPSQ